MSYFATLTERFGQGWNRFWFTPSDPLPLGMLRIASGLVALYTALTYGLDLDRFFGASGILDLETVRTLNGTTNWRFSYFDYMHTSNELWTAHFIGIAVLVLFTLGVFTRVTSVLSLIVVLSYFHRGPMLVGEFEPVLSFVLFYLCLGPSGATLSVDAWLRQRSGGDKPRIDPQTGKSVGSLSWGATVVVRLVQVHLAVTYLMMALGKLQGVVWWDGTAVWWLAMNTQASAIDFTWLAKHPFVVNAWTHAIVAYELLFPVLVWHPLARPLVLSLGVVLWLSIGLLTGLLTLAMLMIAVNLAFFDASQLRALGGSLSQRRVASIPSAGR